MAAPNLDWHQMGSNAARLIDWRTASDVGRRIAGSGVSLPALERARFREDFAESVREAEQLVLDFTGMHVEGYRARAWVMSRGEWLNANLRGLQNLLEPLAQRALNERQLSTPEFRRKAFGAQIGVLLGYVSKKVLGQYDVFLPPDDDGLLYFVGPNVAEVERRFQLPSHDFHLWLALHEVTHRVQFGGCPWLRSHLSSLVDSYLSTVELDPHQLMDQLKRAVAEARAAGGWREANVLFLLMTPSLRELFERMQALMSLIEGHASYVMNVVSADRVKDLPRMRRSLKDRRRASSMERAFQKAIGFDQKIRQYDIGERFVEEVVRVAGMEGFNLMWKDEANLPTLAEVADPGRWLARVANA
jgi:coenzyme F420 biosynthesis associated uncharacterized protein